MSKFQINFVGKQKELHKFLKKQTKEADRTMNGTIIELIKNFKKKYDKNIL